MLKKEFIKEEKFFRSWPKSDKRSPITPWGKADHVIKLTNGITIYSTPSHGGAYIPKALRSKLPAEYVNVDGWYEEDCEFSKVVLAFPELFESESVEYAKKSWQQWFNADGTYKQFGT